jgi:geranylgeranyl diphosphate synthase type II
MVAEHRSDGAVSRRAGLPTIVENGAHLLELTVEALATRAPSVIAEAARELATIVLSLHFGDGSHVVLWADHNTLRTARKRSSIADVEAYMDDASLLRLFEREQRPAEILSAQHFDVRGAAPAVLAVWSVFRVLAQRAAGLRAVQEIWIEYRRRIPREAGDVGRTGLPGPGAPAPDAAGRMRAAGRDNRNGAPPTTSVLWDGVVGAGWWTTPGPHDADLFFAMDLCQRQTIEELFRLIPQREPDRPLYALLRDYPGRGGKGLRALLCMATCGAFGGRSTDVLRTAAAIEMFHNAFLIHDDIEDESDSRRGSDCLHLLHGIPLAINAGDAMNLQAVDAVFSNIERLGLARTLGLMHEIINMCQITLEGQAIELSWIRNRHVPRRDADYIDMVTRKTAWYTCIAPCRLGAIAAGHVREAELEELRSVFLCVGVAFQIQDDLLNLVGEVSVYGKEILGDLLEGKRTLFLIHLLRSLHGAERKSVMNWLGLPRREKGLEEARWIVSLMQREGSIEHGRSVASRLAARAARLFETRLRFVAESDDKARLRQVVHYVNTRSL